MYKRILMLILGLCLLAAAVLAEESGRMLRGMAGDVGFTVTGHVSRVEQIEYPGVWKDGVQLMGRCAEDGKEFQLYSADVAGLIDYFKGSYPEESETDWQIQALMNYGLFFANTYGAEVSDVQVRRLDRGIRVVAHFTYPDDPSVPYRMAGILSGTRATALVLEECEHNLAAADELRLLTAEEQTARAPQPTFIDACGLEAVFPDRPEYGETEQSANWYCFCPDWSWAQVSYMPIGLLPADTEEAQRKAMMDIAGERMMAASDTKIVRDPVLTQAGPELWQLDFLSVDASSLPEEMAPAMRCRLYAGSEGLWYVYACDTEVGRRFLDSLHPATGASATDLPPAQTELPAETAQPSAKEGVVTLTDFRADFERLLNEGAFEVKLRPGNFIWSDAIGSGGQWMRILYTAELAVGIQLRMTGAEAGAAIREARALRYRDDSFPAAPDPEWEQMVKLCSAALTGSAEGWTPEELAPEHSDLRYQRVRLMPPAAPEAAEVWPEPDEAADIPMMAHSGVTAGQLEERMKALAPGMTGAELFLAGTEQGSDGTPMNVYTLERSPVGIVVSLDGSGEDGEVTRIAIIGMQAESAPMVLGTTMMCYAAVNGMAEEDLPSLTWTLLETPMWDDLADLWPLLGNHRFTAFVQWAGDDERMQPLGIVTGTEEWNR